MRTTGVEGGEEREGQCVCLSEKERWERGQGYMQREGRKKIFGWAGEMKGAGGGGESERAR